MALAQEARAPNRYHWLVLAIASLGWLFNTMDEQLLNIARVPAIRELLVQPGAPPPPRELVAEVMPDRARPYALGLPFAPETNGQPLPEEDAPA